MGLDPCAKFGKNLHMAGQISWKEEEEHWENQEGPGSSSDQSLKIGTNLQESIGPTACTLLE